MYSTFMWHLSLIPFRSLTTPTELTQTLKIIASVNDELWLFAKRHERNYFIISESVHFDLIS